MLYAHYEGFCISAINVYLGHLVALGVAPIRCRRPLLELALDKPLKGIRGSQNAGQLYDFFLNDFRRLLRKTVDFVEDKKHGGYEIRGRSNLYPEDLAATCDSVCLPHDKLDLHQTRLRVLVIRRNMIAHGKDVAPLGVDQFRRFEEAAVDVMHDLAFAIISAIDSKLYLALETVDYII